LDWTLSVLVHTEKTCNGIRRDYESADSYIAQRSAIMGVQNAIDK
jgi:hypothetical protein